MKRFFTLHALRITPYALLFLFLISCGKTYYSHYYILDYTPSIPDSIKIYPQLPYYVEVSDFDISLTYDRSAIVIRNSLHQLRYSRYDLWALRPQDAIQDLLLKHLKEANLFADVKKEFLDVRPDFTILGHICNIELYHSEGINRADIEMELSLQDNQNENIVVSYHFVRYERLDTQNMAFFAKKISDILKEENNKFILKIIKYFEEQR